MTHSDDRPSTNSSWHHCVGNATHSTTSLPSSSSLQTELFCGLFVSSHRSRRCCLRMRMISSFAKRDIERQHSEWEWDDRDGVVDLWTQLLLSASPLCVWLSVFGFVCLIFRVYAVVCRNERQGRSGTTTTGGLWRDSPSSSNYHLVRLQAQKPSSSLVVSRSRCRRRRGRQLYLSKLACVFVVSANRGIQTHTLFM